MRTSQKRVWLALVFGLLLVAGPGVRVLAQAAGDEGEVEDYDEEDYDYNDEGDDLDVGDISGSEDEDDGDDGDDSEPKNDGPEPTATVNLPGEDGSAQYTAPSVADAIFLATFQDDWQKTWVASSASKYNGVWEVGTGKIAYLPGDKGLIIPQKARHYGIAAHVKNLDTSSFVLQFETRFDGGLTCSGAYLKLPTEALKDLSAFDNDATYSIMFGPDKCGGTSKVHFIFQSLNPKTGKYTEHHLKSPPSVPTPTEKGRTHLFTLIITNTNEFEVLVNGESKSKGSLAEDFEPAVQPPEEIADPEDKKPEDWVDAKKIPDPEATKPEDWDEDAPKQIPDESAEKPEGWLDDAVDMLPDPEAVKPEDWDEEEDGEWEPAMVPNPACEEVGCGEWKRPTIANPAYKGPWKAPMIDNPAYVGEWAPRNIANPVYYKVDTVKLLPINAVGVEIWVMDHGILFDNVLISETADTAKTFADSTWALKEAAREAADKAKKEKSASETKGVLGSAQGLVARLDRILEPVDQLLVKAGLGPAMDKMIDMGVAKPVFVAVSAPIVIVLLMLSCLVGGKKKPVDAAAVAKKTDAATPDDPPSGSLVRSQVDAIETKDDSSTGMRRRRAD